MVSVQIFGLKNSQATRAAERFFKERRVTIHMVDLKQKPLAARRDQAIHRALRFGRTAG